MATTVFEKPMWYNVATQSEDGLMSSTDKTKLDGVATGATANTGTITGITMNGASKGTSGVVDLGTVITSHQDISGKVSGPSSATSNAVAIFDGTGGKTIKDSGYTIGKSVPSNAVFTDTTYSDATQSAAGLMSATDKAKLDGVATGATNVTIVNNLTTDDSTKALSAAQGYVLGNKLTNFKSGPTIPYNSSHPDDILWMLQNAINNNVFEEEVVTIGAINPSGQGFYIARCYKYANMWYGDIMVDYAGNMTSYSVAGSVVTLVNNVNSPAYFESLEFNGNSYAPDYVAAVRAMVDSLPLVNKTFIVRLSCSSVYTCIVNRIPDAGYASVLFYDYFGRMPHFMCKSGGGWSACQELALNSDKVNIAQGSGNAGKLLGINSSGNVEPVADNFHDGEYSFRSYNTWQAALAAEKSTVFANGDGTYSFSCITSGGAPHVFLLVKSNTFIGGTHQLYTGFVETVYSTDGGTNWTTNDISAQPATSLNRAVKCAYAYTEAALTTGWKKVALLSGNQGGKNFIVSLQSTYSSPHDSEAIFLVSIGYETGKISMLQNTGNNLQFSKARIRRVGEDTAYLEFYYEGSQYSNYPSATIINFDGYDLTTYAFTDAENNNNIFSEITFAGKQMVVGGDAWITGNLFIGSGAANPLTNGAVYTVNNVNLNDYKTTGFYQFGQGCSNSPGDWFGCCVIDCGGIITQFGFVAGIAAFRIRGYINGGWTSWHECGTPI